MSKPGHLSVNSDLSPTAKELLDATGRLQAARIFNLLNEKLKDNPDKKIALIYAANNEQAKLFHLAYETQKTPEVLPHISGSGQAIFFKALIALINNQNKNVVGFSGKIRILPVATSLFGGENNPGNIVSAEMICRDLEAIQDHLQAGYDVEGIPRGETEEFAIGGGNSKNWLTTQYATISYDGKTVSQDAYVQARLRRLIEQSDAKISPPKDQDEMASDLRNKLGYRYATPLSSQGRMHLFSADSRRLKAEFAGLTGDALKTAILCSFKNDLEQCQGLDLDALNDKITALEATPEYATLKKGQGLATLLFSLETDSIKAFEHIKKEAREKLNPRTNNMP